MTIHADYISTLAKKAFIAFSGTAASALIARYLGADMRAEYAFILNFSAILVVIFNGGLNNYYQHFRRSYGPQACPIFVALTFKISLLLLSLSVVSFSIIDNRYFAIVLIASISLLRMQLQTVSLVESVRGAAISTILGSSVELAAIVLLLAFFEPAVEWVLYGFIAKELSISVLSMVAIVRSPDQAAIGLAGLSFWRSMIGSTYPILRNSVSRAAPMFVLSIAIVVLYKGDVIILSWYGVDKAAIGIYVIGVLVAEYLWVFTDIFKDVQTSRTARGEAAHGVAAAHRGALLLTFLFYLLFIAFGYIFIVVLFGREFSESYRVAIFMLIANIFMTPPKILGAYLISTYQIKEFLFAMVAAAALNVGLNLFLVPQLGTDGALLSNVISYFLGGVIVTVSFMRRGGIGAAELLLVKPSDVTRIIAGIRRRGSD